MKVLMIITMIYSNNVGMPPRETFRGLVSQTLCRIYQEETKALAKASFKDLGMAQVVQCIEVTPL